MFLVSQSSKIPFSYPKSKNALRAKIPRTNAIKIKKLSEDAIVPKYAHATDAGLDFFSSETITIPPNERRLISTGISMAIPEGHVGLIWDRSSMAVKYGVTTLAGVIDSGYRGEWKIILLNTTDKPFEIKAGDKIIQCVLQEFAPVEIEEVTELVESERAEAGFGSSGR